MHSCNVCKNEFSTFILYKASEIKDVAGCDELRLLVENKIREEAVEEIIMKAQSYAWNVIS